jgi:hypothetical protein
MALGEAVLRDIYTDDETPAKPGENPVGPVTFDDRVCAIQELLALDVDVVSEEAQDAEVLDLLAVVDRQAEEIERLRAELDRARSHGSELDDARREAVRNEHRSSPRSARRRRAGAIGFALAPVRARAHAFVTTLLAWWA